MLTFDVSAEQYSEIQWQPDTCCFYYLPGHIDFSYDKNYLNRKGPGTAPPYRVQTRAVLYASDDRQLCSIPRFTFYGESIDDYKRISTFPNNDSTCINSINLSKQQNLFSPGLFEESFFQWPNDRILFQENDGLAAGVKKDGLNFAADQFNRSIKIFMNFNTVEDPIHILTEAIIDPVECYYLLPLDNVTHCFICIWFDLFEAGRRSFGRDLKSRHVSVADIQMKYDEFMLRIERLKLPYTKETERGTRIARMQKWNKVVPDDPGIDNMAFFRMN